MSQSNIKGPATSKKCEFCDIANEKTRGYIVFEDNVSLAFLDTRPLFPGHCLLIPKEHIPTLAELNSPLIEPIFTNVKMLAQAVEEAMEAEGTFIAMNNKVSQSVPHLHVHIVPRRKKDGLKGFFWPRNPYKDDKEMEEVQNKIKSAVSNTRNNTKLTNR
ncbi:MAG: HIT family protein [Thermodesulfobacteriota bacterium]